MCKLSEYQFGSDQRHKLLDHFFKEPGHEDLMDAEYLHWSDFKAITRHMFFVFEGMEFANDTGKKSDRKVVPNYDRKDWRATEEQILEARLLFVDLDGLDIGASCMNLAPMWKKKMYDPTGEYKDKRHFLVAISK